MKPEDRKVAAYKTHPVMPEKTTPAEEWGERIETARDIAREGAGKDKAADAADDEPVKLRSGR